MYITSGGTQWALVEDFVTLCKSITATMAAICVCTRSHNISFRQLRYNLLSSPSTDNPEYSHINYAAWKNEKKKYFNWMLSKKLAIN